MKTDTGVCFYLPKQMMKEEYQNFSAESKLLFAMIFTNASSYKAIQEVASLIQAIETKKLSEMHKQYLSIEHTESEEL